MTCACARLAAPLAAQLRRADEGWAGFAADGAAAEGSAHLGEFTTALLDEVEGLAKNEEVPEPDRLCYPSSAVDGVRLATWAYCAPRV